MHGTWVCIYWHEEICSISCIDRFKGSKYKSVCVCMCVVTEMKKSYENELTLILKTRPQVIEGEGALNRSTQMTNSTDVNPPMILHGLLEER